MHQYVLLLKLIYSHQHSHCLWPVSCYAQVQKMYHGVILATGLCSTGKSQHGHTVLPLFCFMFTSQVSTGLFCLRCGCVHRSGHIGLIETESHRSATLFMLGMPLCRYLRMLYWLCNVHKIFILPAFVNNCVKHKAVLEAPSRHLLNIQPCYVHRHCLSFFRSIDISA